LLCLFFVDKHTPDAFQMLLALLAAEILICLVLNSIVNIFLLLSSIVNIFPHFDLIRLLLQYSFKF